MKNIIVVLLPFVVCAPSFGILVDAADDTSSLALADTYPFMCCAAGWDSEDGPRYRAGSGTLIRNNEIDGAWILTAGHAARRDTTGETFNILRYTFTSYFEAFPKGTTSYLPDKCTAAIHERVYYCPSQDIALLKLEYLVRDSTGCLITPIEFYSGPLVDDQVILIGGYGETGIPSQGGPQCTGYRDGYKRCARGIFICFNAGKNKLLTEFHRTVPIPGMASCADSGGFAAIEEEQQLLMVGVIVTGSGSGETALTGCEYLGYNPEFFSWMEDIIAANGETPSAVENWDMY